MNLEVKQKWIELLRSNKYNQCKGQLKCNNSFCALGLLCLLYQEEVNGNLEFEGIYFGPTSGYAINGGYVPDCVYEWSDLTEENIDQIEALNDSANLTFKEIADYVEKL